MNDIDLTEIHTFAKHMICPPNIYNLSESELSNKGAIDFDDYPFSELLKKTLYMSNPNDLMKVMINALETLLDKDKRPIILLSDGKDSMLLALALSQMNISCKTLTLLRNNDEDLKLFVKTKALQMGHEPYFISVDSILESYDKATFIDACEKMKSPVLDQGLLFFLFGIKSFLSMSGLKANDCQFIDGLGNDEHLGYLPSKPQLKAFKLSKFNFWKLIPNRYNWVKWYLRSPAEAQGDLSAISCFYPFEKAININEYFSKIPKSSDKELIDFRAFSRGSFHDHQCMIGKTKAAAYSLGSDIIYPWTDVEVSNFCFNLPPTEKYDFDNLKNKICVRKILDKELDWNQDKRGVDLFFDIDEQKLNIMLNDFIDLDVYDHISKRGVLPDSVRKRALLELLNLCGYLHVKGFQRDDIKCLLMGN